MEHQHFLENGTIFRKWTISNFDGFRKWSNSNFQEMDHQQFSRNGASAIFLGNLPSAISRKKNNTQKWNVVIHYFVSYQFLTCLIFHPSTRCFDIEMADGPFIGHMHSFISKTIKTDYGFLAQNQIKICREDINAKLSQQGCTL